MKNKQGTLELILSFLVRLVFLKWSLGQYSVAENLYGRDYTAEYFARRKIVRRIWFVSLMLILLCPFIGFVVVNTLLTTCISFMILDEAKGQLEE